jgi:toxoflavin biosynthesis protein ToxD
MLGIRSLPTLMCALAGLGCAQAPRTPAATPSVANARGNTAAQRLEIPGGPPIELVRIGASPSDGVPRDFLIGKFEVTHAQFEPFIHATHYDGADHPSCKSTEPFLADWTGEHFAPDAANAPVCYLNVHHARAYCAWLSRVTGRTVRLPTDAEWSLAAMGPGLQRVYPWGDTWDVKRANIGGDADGFPEVAPVGSFPSGATPEGIQDMAGNIWEWTTEIGENAEAQRRDQLGGHLRGGPWCMNPETARSAFIAHEMPDRADDKFGLRVLIEIP